MSLDISLGVMQMTAVWEGNVTHNLNKMAEAAGLYKYLWRPEELGITKAGELIEPLQAGLTRLLGARDEMEKYRPDNNWGSYEDLLSFVTSYLGACRANPEATVRANR